MSEEFDFTCNNGAIVRIVIEDYPSYTAIVFDQNQTKIGAIEFDTIEYPDGYVLKMVWAYLDESGPGWTRQGIGSEIVRLVRDVSDMVVIASENDGHQRSDGSHLTGDAPGFVARMKEKGLIASG